MTEEMIDNLIDNLDDVYKNMSDKEKRIVGYQLRAVVDKYLLNYYYAHNVFSDDSIDYKSIRFSIDWIREHVKNGSWKSINVAALELLVCLSHMKLKDKIKVIYFDLVEYAPGLNNPRNKEHNKRMQEEIDVMNKDGDIDYVAIIMERRDEIERLVEDRVLSSDILELYL